MDAKANVLEFWKRILTTEAFQLFHDRQIRPRCPWNLRLAHCDSRGALVPRFVLSLVSNSWIDIGDIFDRVHREDQPIAPGTSTDYWGKVPYHSKSHEGEARHRETLYARR